MLICARPTLYKVRFTAVKAFIGVISHDDLMFEGDYACENSKIVKVESQAVLLFLFRI